MEVFFIYLVIGAFLHYSEASPPCPLGYRQCPNRRCIPQHYFCDGGNDCGDYFDEINC
ncbi:hypothetical protein AVEN_241229-1, partial [Araneus ventricosus]